MGEWISIQDRLPEKEIGQKFSMVPCLVFRNNQIEILVFNHFSECWDDADCDDYCCDINAVTHWMPLPKAPKNGI